MEDQNKLITINQNNLVQKVNTSITITNKLIAENNRQLVIEIFDRNPKLFIDLISLFYPLDEKHIEKYSDILNWDCISMNKKLNWTFGFVVKFEKKWNWKNLSKNNSLIWSSTLIDNYQNNIDWYELNNNQSIKWSVLLIRKYKNLLNWNNLSANQNLSWTTELIEDFQEYWNWDKLCSNDSIEWNEYLIEKFFTKIDWYGLSSNKNLDWNIKLIEKYKQYWSWHNLSKNSAIPWTNELIDRFINKWFWEYLSKNKSIPINDFFLDKYKKYLSWKDFLCNESLNWDSNLKADYFLKISNTLDSVLLDSPFNDDDYIREYSIKWKIAWRPTKNDCFPENTLYLDFFYWRSVNIELSQDFLDKYYDIINWEYLSTNENTTWNIELIEKYENEIFWNTDNNHREITLGIFKNFAEVKNLPWSESFIKKFEYRWNWQSLSSNYNLPWNIRLLHKFSEKWFASESIWEIIKPFVDDGLIEEIFKNK